MQPIFLPMKQFILFILLSLLPAMSSSAQETAEDKERLSRAVEYFNTEKYHEAGLIFRELNKKYELNTRFKAYLGICEYHDWNYPAVTEIFDSIHKDLTVYAPREQNVYYNAAAESHLNMENYHDAIRYYKMAMNVCAEQEKADLNYKTGICYLQTKNNGMAKISFIKAIALYRKYPTGRDDKNRIKQIRKMLRGLTN